MPFNTTLSSEELKELNKWMSNLQIKLDNRTRRGLSDVVNVAQIVKKLNSKLVDMSCYRSYSSLALKLENWEIFNFKVLCKLGLKLSQSDLTQLASGSLSALKCLLYYIMTWDRDGLSHRSSCKRNSSTGDNKKISDSLSGSADADADAQHLKIESDMIVPYSKYKLLVQENHKKKKYLSSISHKAKYLESLILVKDERINALLERLAALSAQTHYNAEKL